MTAPLDIRFNGSVLNGSTINANLSEVIGSGELIGRLSATDPDSGDSATFELLSDAGGAVFLDGDLLRATEGAVFDAGTAPSLTISVRVTDGTGNTLTRTLVLGVTNET
mgnify:CR=1 FL=1